MKPYEALGVDGLHMGFFLEIWLLAGDLGKFLEAKVCLLT